MTMEVIKQGNNYGYLYTVNDFGSMLVSEKPIDYVNLHWNLNSFIVSSQLTRLFGWWISFAFHSVNLMSVLNLPKQLPVSLNHL